MITYLPSEQFHLLQQKLHHKVCYSSSSSSFNWCTVPSIFYFKTLNFSLIFFLVIWDSNFRIQGSPKIWEWTLELWQAVVGQFNCISWDSNFWSLHMGGLIWDFNLWSTTASFNHQTDMYDRAGSNELVWSCLRPIPLVVVGGVGGAAVAVADVV